MSYNVGKPSEETPKPTQTSPGNPKRINQEIDTADRTSRVAASSIFQTCRRQHPAGNGPAHLSLASRTAVGLPLDSGRSVPALPISRSARRSLAYRPARSLSRPTQPFCQIASVHFVTSTNRPVCRQTKATIVGWNSTQQRAPPLPWTMKYPGLRFCQGFDRTQGFPCSRRACG